MFQFVCCFQEQHLYEREDLCIESRAVEPQAGKASEGLWHTALKSVTSCPAPFLTVCRTAASHLSTDRLTEGHVGFFKACSFIFLRVNLDRIGVLSCSTGPRGL